LFLYLAHNWNFHNLKELKLIKESEELKKFFDLNYLYMLQKYYLNFINVGKHMMEIDGLKITLSQIKAEFKKIFKNVFFSENELVGSKFLIDKNL